MSRHIRRHLVTVRRPDEQTWIASRHLTRRAAEHRADRQRRLSGLDGADVRVAHVADLKATHPALFVQPSTAGEHPTGDAGGSVAVEFPW